MGIFMLAWRNLCEAIKIPLYKNSIYLILNSAIVSLGGFLFWMIAARLYSSEQVGQATVLFSLASLSASISVFGMDYAIIRLLPISSTPSSDIIIVTICIVVSSVIVPTIISLLFASNSLIIILFISYLLSMLYVLTAYASANKLLKYLFVSSSCLYVLRWLLLSSGILKAVMFSLAGTLLLLALFIYPTYKKSFPIVYRFPSLLTCKVIIVKYLSYSFMSFLLLIASSFSTMFLPYIVSHLLGDSDAAYNYIVGGILCAMAGAILSVSHALFIEGAQNINTAKKLIFKSIIFSEILSVLAIIFSFIFGKIVLKILGEEYALNGYNLLILSSLYLLSVPIIGSYISILRINGGMREAIIMCTIYSSMNLGISYMAMRSIGILGIGVGLIVSSAIVLCYALWRLHEVFS